MKCQQCSKEAPAETDPESGRLRCAHCGAFRSSGTSQKAAIRQAQDILQRWSSEDLLDEISSFPNIPPLPDRNIPEAAESGADEALTERPTDNYVEDPFEADASSLSPTDRKTADPPGTSKPKRILSLAEALQHESAQQNETAGATTTNTSQRESVAVETVEPRPQLTVLQSTPTDEAEASAEPRVVSTASVVAQPAVSLMPDSNKQPATQRQRHVQRSPVRRRRPQSDRPGPSSVSPTDPTQQGMDAVKKKLRVDRPGNHALADLSAQTPAEAEAVDPRAQDASQARRFRVDSPQPVNSLTDGHGRVRGQGRSRQRYIDESHEHLGLRGPHFEMSPPPRSSLTSLTGQFLAYTGVLGLTVGTAIVIYGHFGGMSEYTPTGWLVTTVAQMLLFLGVINLVSGGIEQNNHDVSHRINVLGEQLMRMQEVTESAVRGPKIPAERYAGHDAEDVSERETVGIDERR